MLDIDKVFLFIGGLHRSGTSLLHRCIAEHPRVSGFSGVRSFKDEGQYLQNIYRPDDAFGGPGFFGFDSGSHLDESSHLANKKTAQKLFDEWSVHWDLNKPILVEKSPPNLIRGRFLQTLFPNTKLIMVVRHPIAVSYATKKWANLLDFITSRVFGRSLPSRFRPHLPHLGLPIWLLIRHWMVCHDRFRRDRSQLKNLMVIRYEDLTDRPASVLENVWEFLDLEVFNPMREIKSGINQKYFDRWRKLKNKGG